VRRLVQNEEVVILVEDIQRNGFGFGLRRFGGGYVDLDLLASVQQSRRAHDPTPDPDQSSFDPPFGLGSARFFKVVGNGSVDAYVLLLD
jgi:hypothetical protein